MCKTIGVKVKSTFRQSQPSYGPHCEEVFFYDDTSAADKQWISDIM